MSKSTRHACSRAAAAVLIGLVLVGCASTPSASPSAASAMSRGGQAPVWVSDKDSVYPTDKYLAELGEGDSLKGAKSNAAGAIAQIFRTKVTVDSTVRTRYTEISGEGGDILDMVLQTDIDQNIGQSAEESLSNMKYGESWQDDMGRVYVVAYLDRAETGNLYRQRIIKNGDRVMELIDRSLAQEETLRRYAFMDAAVVMAEANAMLVEQLEIINMPMSRAIIHPYDSGNLRAQKADQAAALMIQVAVSGDDEGQIEATLFDWVTGKGFSISAEGEMFLSAVVLIRPIELDNDYENLNWELNLNLLNSQGIPAVSLPHQARSSGISESAAMSRVYQDMTNMIRKDFDKAFTEYLNSFLEK